MGDQGGSALPPIPRRGTSRGPSPSRAASARGVSGWEDVTAGPPSSRDLTRRSADGAGWGGVTSGPTRLERPNLGLFGGLVSATVMTVVLVLGGTQTQLGIAIVVGMFVGVVLLGLARLDVNGKRAGGRFADWQVESVRIATLLFVIGWIAGLVSLWRFALVLSRWFT